MQTPVMLGQLIDSLDLLFVPPAEQPEPESAVTEQPQPVAQRGHVLLVEDNRVNQMVAKKILGKLGFSVTTASDGAEALDRVAEGSYDLIFMDIQMPVLDGYEATRKIRAAEKGSEQRHTIIAMTANAMSGDRERCLASGMDDYVAKPIKISELKQKVEQWCGVR